MSVSVIIPVCGDVKWDDMAKNAAASADRQTRRPDEIITVRADTVADARNAGASKATSEWLIFLDADDELDEHYIEEMFRGVGDIRRPSTLGFYEDGTEDDFPVLIPEMDLRTGNYIVIGAMCRRSQFVKARGFQDYDILEDWDLWLTMVENGAVVEDCPGAIYRVGVHPGSRNTNPMHHKIYNEIYTRHR